MAKTLVAVVVVEEVLVPPTGRRDVDFGGEAMSWKATWTWETLRT